MSTLSDIKKHALATNGRLQQLAANVGHKLMIYLHWSAGVYVPNAINLADYQAAVQFHGEFARLNQHHGGDI